MTEQEQQDCWITVLIETTSMLVHWLWLIKADLEGQDNEQICLKMCVQTDFHWVPYFSKFNLKGRQTFVYLV